MSTSQQSFGGLAIQRTALGYIGPKSDSPGTKKVVEQLKNRFYDMQRELGHPLNSMFGVGLDGNYFVFIRYRDNKWQQQEPVEVSKYSTERFLWALYNLGQKGKPFSSEYLALDFGSDSPLAQDGVRTLYEAISTTDHPKAQVFSINGRFFSVRRAVTMLIIHRTRSKS